MQFAAIKRSINNDNNERERESYKIKIFNSKNEAASWLIQNYEYYHDHITDAWDINNPGWSMMHDFFLNAKDGEIIFHWEWIPPLQHNRQP